MIVVYKYISYFRSTVEKNHLTAIEIIKVLVYGFKDDLQLKKELLLGWWCR